MNAAIIVIQSNEELAGALRNQILYLRQMEGISCPAEVIGASQQEFRDAWKGTVTGHSELLETIVQAKHLLLMAAGAEASTYLGGLNYAQWSGEKLSGRGRTRQGGELTICCPWQAMALGCQRLGLRKIWLATQPSMEENLIESNARYWLEACGFEFNERLSQNYGNILVDELVALSGELERHVPYTRAGLTSQELAESTPNCEDLMGQVRYTLCKAAETDGLEGVITGSGMEEFQREWQLNLRRRPEWKNSPTIVSAMKAYAEIAWEWIDNPTVITQAVQKLTAKQMRALQGTKFSGILQL